jgi:probable HAF family extracellular repeat protein
LVSKLAKRWPAVLGTSFLPDNTTFHSFLWQKNVITDLGTLPGNPLTFAGGINNRGRSWGTRAM